MTSDEFLAQASSIIGDVGGHFMLHPTTAEYATEQGFPNLYVFYGRGRGGVLGEVDADVVSSAFGFFNPSLIRGIWESGVEILGARETGALFSEAAARFGRRFLTGIPGLDEFITAATKVVDAADVWAMPLFAGWRAEPRATDAPAHAYQLMNVLREMRGGAHLVACVTKGLLGPVPVLINGGPEVASLFGWTADLPEVDDRRADWEEAEALTTQLVTPAWSVLDSEEAARVLDVLNAAQAAVAEDA